MVYPMASNRKKGRGAAREQRDLRAGNPSPLEVPQVRILSDDFATLRLLDILEKVDRDLRLANQPPRRADLAAHDETRPLAS